MLSVQVAAAQDDGPYGYALYYQCDPQGLAAVDESVASAFGPAFDRMVADGDLMAWGWVAHHTGGPWDRELWFNAPTVQAVLVQLDRWRQANRTERSQETSVLLSSCPEQEEYVWRTVEASESGVGALVPNVEFVIYYECQAGSGERADAIFHSAFRPLLNDEVAAGTIPAWYWIEKVVGGNFSRALVIEGATHRSNAQVVQRVRAALPTERAEEFGGICNRHQDYMWTIRSSGS